MFGQASPRWPTSIALVLMVAFFGVYLNSDLYLASPVTDKPGHSNDMTSAGSDHNSDPSTPALNCVFQQHMNDFKACCEKAKKEDFSEISNEKCSDAFATYQCQASTYCAHCSNKGDPEIILKKFAEGLENDEKLKEKCKEWESKAPKVPSTCTGGGQRSGDASDKPSYLIYIIVVVVLVVAVIIAVVVYCLMCTGDSKGHSAKPGKSSKGSKSMKAGKSNKSGIKGGKSTKSSKSAKSGKSLKGGKSTKSSKGGKSAKK